MTSISTTITTNIDKKIQQFIDALSEQLSIEKDELYEIFNNIVESDEEEEEEVSDSSEEKEEEPVAVQQSVYKGKCEYIYTKGKSEGTRCTTNVEGSKFCKKHSSSSSEVKTEVKTPELKQAPARGKCEYVFTKGKNEGQRCTTNVEGTKFCKKHCKDSKEDDEEVKKEVKVAKKESPPKKTAKTAKVVDEQKDKETINRLVESNMSTSTTSSPKEEKVVKKSEPVLSLSRNRFGNFEMPETGFVFDPKTRQVIGTQNESGNIDDLTVEDIALCKEYGFHNVRVPEKLKSVGSDSESSEDDYEIEDEEDDNDDDDEEDYDEEDEDD
jgi:hypothetical protein